MEFLRRLAPPSLAGDRSCAVPLLAPRFAVEAPLRSVAGSARAEPMSSAPLFGAVTMAARGAGRPDLATGPAADAPFREPAPAPRERGGDAARGEPSPDRRALSAAIEPAAADARPAVHDAVMAAFPAAVPSGDPRVDGGGADAPVARTAPSPPRPAARPLSQHALDARISAAAPVRPVIQVTIDRIDVRLPATPPRAADPPRPRRDTPSLPLADYLRGRGSA